MTAANKGEYKARLKALMESASLNQAQLAKKIGVPPSLISLVLKDRLPSTDLLVKLGNAAAAEKFFDQARWFWSEAGLNVQGMVTASMDLLKGMEAPITRGEVTSVPASKLFGQPGQKDRRLLFPASLLPNPVAASYIAIPDDSIRPMLKQGDVLVLNEENTDLWNLVGSFVALDRHTARVERVHSIRQKLSDSEFSQYPELSRRPDRLGLYVGWLRANGREGSTVLTIEFPSRLGGISSEVVAFEISPMPGSSMRRRIEVPEFNTLGAVVAWFDLRGRMLPLENKAADKAEEKAPNKVKSGPKEKKKK